MTIYQCKLCNKNMNIEVYTMSNEKNFVCPCCLYEKKVEIGCVGCGNKIKKYVGSTMDKCFKCYKNAVIS